MSLFFSLFSFIYLFIFLIPFLYFSLFYLNPLFFSLYSLPFLNIFSPCILFLSQLPYSVFFFYSPSLFDAFLKVPYHLFKNLKIKWSLTITCSIISPFSSPVGHQSATFFRYQLIRLVN